MKIKPSSRVAPWPIAEERMALAQRYNIVTDGTMVVPGEYLEVVIKVR